MLFRKLKGSFAYTLVEPFGVVAALTPWNPALLHILQKGSHAMAAGNTIVFKLSPLACLSAYALASLIEEAGFPAGVFNFITGGGEAARALIEHQDVDLVSFTGSTTTGRTVAASAGPPANRFILNLAAKPQLSCLTTRTWRPCRKTSPGPPSAQQVNHARRQHVSTLKMVCMKTS